ncbi:MAG: hypothetical protein H7A38_02345 [Chlamydiales bacterium]|nr:hypothetical protein [Chlamydiales bacterium]
MMVGAISKISLYTHSNLSQGAYSLVRRIAKPALALLFTVSIIAVAVFRVFRHIAQSPHFLEQAIREGREGDVEYYLRAKVPFDPVLLFEAKNPRVITLLLENGADMTMVHEGKSLLEHLFHHLTNQRILNKGEIKKKDKPWAVLMLRLYQPSDLEKAITEGKWAFAALLMQLDRKENLPPLLRAEHRELVSALLDMRIDRKVEYEGKDFLSYLFEKGWGDLAEKAWDDEYLKDRYLPNLQETLKDAHAKKIKFQDHPRHLLRQFLVKKRQDNVLKTVAVNHGADPVKYFEAYQEIGFEKFDHCLNQFTDNPERKKGVWSSIAGQFILFKISTSTYDWGLDEELLKFGEKGVDFHELDEKIREPVREKIKAGYPPSLLFGLYLLGKKELLMDLVNRGYLDPTRFIHQDDAAAIQDSTDPIVQSYVMFIRALLTARFSSLTAGVLPAVREPLALEERSSTR